MKKLTISPAWVFRTEQGDLIDPQMFSLLKSIHGSEKLTVSAAAAGISYRHAWNLLNRWADFFGMPLVVMRKGQGTRLSPLGEKLLWAEQRVLARLGPQIESMASDLNVELQQLLEGVHPVLRLHASHGYAVALLPKYRDEVELNLQYCNPEEALVALNRGDCDIAGFHLPTRPDFSARILSTYRHLLIPGQHRVIRFITRRQGLMIRNDSHDRIAGLADLSREGVRFINRQKNSGTRALFNLLLEAANIPGEGIAGFEREEYTHSAVAAYVASGMADAGFGVEPAARQFGLEFLPMASEHYLIICRHDRLQEDRMQRFLALIRSSAFHAAVSDLPGYSPDRCGEVDAIENLVEGETH